MVEKAYILTNYNYIYGVKTFPQSTRIKSKNVLNNLSFNCEVPVDD